MTGSGRLRGASDRVRRRLVWAVPVVVVGVVVAGATLLTNAASGASPRLAPRTAAQLLTAIQQSTATALSGQLTETANLGLPSLPGGESGASLSWQSFVTGSHSARVWADGPDRQRVALLGQLSEADVVHNGRDVWTYTSDTNSVTHTTLGSGGTKDTGPVAAELTPSAVTARVLKAITPSTVVTVDTSRTVAHRAAYTLVLRPRDTRSTVAKVTIAVDAARFVPLQVQVFGAAAAPAFTVGFTQISFTRPAASIFRFHTPAGASTSGDPFGTNSRHADGPHSRPARSTSAVGVPATPGSAKVIGSGWTAVLELPRGAANGLSGGLLRELSSAVGNSGERLLHTALVNAVIMPDGRTFVGAVNPALLEHVAASTPR